MIPHLEVDKEHLRSCYKSEQDYKDALEMHETASEFQKFDAYLYDADIWLALGSFKEYKDWNSQPRIVDYSYGLTVESVEKYILDNYGESNPDKFLVEVSLMSPEYEKPWKRGTYIDLDGNDTGRDWYDVIDDNYIKEHSEIDGKFIHFSVYDISHKRED